MISDSFKTMGIERSGCARLADGTIAGAVQSVGQTIFNLENWGIPLEAALYAAIDVPYRAMGMDVPAIEPGQKACLAAFDLKTKLPVWQLPAER